MATTTVGPAASWRLVHDDVKVMALFESAGFTTSINRIFEAGTQAECEAEIARLDLIALPDVIAE